VTIPFGLNHCIKTHKFDVGFEFGWVVRLAGIEPAAFRSGAERSVR
jgi:hypothetical protein